MITSTVCGSLVALLLLSNSVSAEYNCSVPVTHYEELKCKPIISEGANCPSRFECPDFTAADPTKCYVNGKTFNDRDQIEDEDIKHPCKPSCYCGGFGGTARVTCAHVDCPEFFGGGPDSEERNCIRQKSFDSCCSVKTICDAEEIKKLATCEIDGETYREGQSIYPKSHPCHHCICSAEFDANNIDNSAQCKRLSCGVDHEHDRFHDGCVPIFYGTNSCCPIDWRCPSAKKDSDKVVAGEGRNESVDEFSVCSFGSLKMNIGDTLNKVRDNVDCTCMVPPMPSCIQKPRNYNE